MLIGYARVSTDTQDVSLQERALKEFGCERIFIEVASGGKRERPQLEKALEQLRSGDVFVVWKLDRLSRSLKDLLFIIERIDQHGAGFRSLTESIETVTPAGRMLMQMLGVCAEYERAMIRERTRAGVELARKNGRFAGRPSKLDQTQQNEILAMITSGQKNMADTARLFRVHPATICRMVARHQK